MTQLIEADSRGRLSLGRPNERYLIEVEDDGTTVLTPAVVVSKTENALLHRPEILSLIEENRKNGLKGRTWRPDRRQ